MTTSQIMGERIRRMREWRGLTQRQLAAEIGISNRSLSQIETGRVTDPGATRVAAIARVLRISGDYLLGLTDKIELSDAMVAQSVA
jgi:transcriptional regulator with XRE-family HTH domain